jgi:hypothetical protein
MINLRYVGGVSDIEFSEDSSVSIVLVVLVSMPEVRLVTRSKDFCFPSKRLRSTKPFIKRVLEGTFLAVKLSEREADDSLSSNAVA